MRFYKVLNTNLTARNGGTYQYRVGEWTPPIEQLEPCESGYHVCQESDLIEWLGPVICPVDLRGPFLRANSKTVATSIRIEAPLATWNERTQRLFACDCAERVLPVFERDCPDDTRPRLAIETARLYAVGEATKGELTAALDAAVVAAGYAAGYAADAAGAAAWDAERQWQAQRLMQYLRGEM